MPHRVFTYGVLSLVSLLSTGCRPRSFNSPQADLLSAAPSTKVAAQSSGFATPFQKWDLAILWPRPASELSRQKMLTPSDFKLSKKEFANILVSTHAAAGSTPGELPALSNPLCYFDMSNWKLTAVRFAPYSHSLPGASVLAISAQPKNSGAKAANLNMDFEGFDPVAEIRLVFQPWCLSEKLKGKQLLFALDQAMTFKFRPLPQSNPDSNLLPVLFAQLQAVSSKAIETSEPQYFSSTRVDALAQALNSATYAGFRKKMLAEFLEISNTTKEIPKSLYSALQNQESQALRLVSGNNRVNFNLSHPGFAAAPAFEQKLRNFLNQYAVRDFIFEASVLLTQGLNPTPFLTSFAWISGGASSSVKVSELGMAHATVFATLAGSADKFQSTESSAVKGVPLVPLAVGKTSQQTQWLHSNAEQFRMGYEAAQSGSQDSSPRILDQNSTPCTHCHNAREGTHLLGFDTDEHQVISERTFLEIALEEKLLMQEMAILKAQTKE